MQLDRVPRVRRLSRGNETRRSVPERTGIASLCVGLVALFAGASPAASTGSEPSSSEIPASSPAIHRGSLVAARSWHPIPSFSRQYRTGCSTCHTAAPKLNVLGEAFRLNGYRMPASELLIREDGPVPLGADEWRDEWPRAIWPGEIPGQSPLAVRVQSDVRMARTGVSAANVSFAFPSEVYLLAGAPLGGSVSTFLESAWSRDAGLQVFQAKLLFQDPIPPLPQRTLNLWVGLQNPFLLTFADRQIDRAGRHVFRWQVSGASGFELVNTGGGLQTVVSENRFLLIATQPSVELNGLLGSRFYYGVGLAQGTRATRDNNDSKDLYYKLRYKVGGLSLRGSYGRSQAPVLRSGGQLLDRAVIFEHFGYFGREPAEGERQDPHRTFGVSARVLNGPLDVGVGWVRRDHDAPWGSALSGSLSVQSTFGKLEYLMFPWLIGSLKAERFRARLHDVPAGWQFDGSTPVETRVLPGLIALVRQNLRLILEGELFAKYEGTASPPGPRPHSFDVRIDWAF